MIKVDKIIPGGQSIATLEDGKKIFFWNALPGETVTDYIITKNKSHYIEAIANQINNSSAHRVVPKDECFLSTSPWQNMDYKYELQTKRELVVEIFREHNINISTPPIFTDDRDYFYRNKMEYSLYYDNEKATIFPAFHTRGSHRKIPIANSSIERPELFAKATEIINGLNARHEEARKYQSLLLRCNQTGEVSGGLFENGKPHPTFKNLTDTILGYQYSYSPNGFFQINLPVYELALKEIQKHITTDEVLDLYAGVGTIGLSVARPHKLTLVESDKLAFREQAKNITAEDIPERGSARYSAGHPWRRDDRTRVQSGNILGLLAKAEDVLSYISPSATTILDPPRAGCDTKLINRLLEVTPPKIIYLSCNPATQARDVSALLQKYQIDTVKTFNFFPRTPHIENLIILSLK
ncbi:class I SAM-dependent RNA methyltransferase [Candidatus Saccharibacteria bacterium]|nr:class I SAM-dependent RNA methyltransferase [Candidatus Saccharibacteria bacterium]